MDNLTIGIKLRSLLLLLIFAFPRAFANDVSIAEIFLVKQNGPRAQQYIQVPEPQGLYYYPKRSDNEIELNRGNGNKGRGPETYATQSKDELGMHTILLKIHDFHNSKTKFILLERDMKHIVSFTYNVLEITEDRVRNPKYSQIHSTIAKVVPRNYLQRSKRSPGAVRDFVKDTHQTFKNGVNKLLRKTTDGNGKSNNKTGELPKKIIIHLPALFIDKEKDGFEHIFYQDMAVAALCLTNQPDLDRHEIRDEYEAVVCLKKGYAAILPEDAANGGKKRSVPFRQSASPESSLGHRRRREDYHYHEHDADAAKWHLDKNKYDTLWKVDNNTSTESSTSSTGNGGSEIVEDINYDYEFSEEIVQSNGTEGWESDEVIDPHDLDFVVWPSFLPVTGEEKINKSDQLRSNLHHHTDKNYTLEELHELLQENHTELIFDSRRFALNDSDFLGLYYTQIFSLWSYNYEPLIHKFFANPDSTLAAYDPEKLTLESIRQLFLLFIINVHHVNCFNRHIRFYGYVQKRPASINGDEITNNGRLTRGIIMRALELLRHIPQYNVHKELILRLLIASLKERARAVQHSTKLLEENDFTELFEVASYLEHLLQHGIHPDVKNQDLFVEETRFYAHHFMNTLTL